jgi:uncharacterized protein (TIGR02246 family)
MNDSKRLEIEALCTRLSIQYCIAVDARDYDTFAGLFTEDAVWTTPDKRQWKGHAGIREFTSKIDAKLIRHLASNILVDVLDEDRARGGSSTTVYRYMGDEVPAPMDGPSLIVENRDEYRRTAKGWRIASRVIVPVFKQVARGA